DVRCVAASSCGEVLTASRDATLRVWARAVDAPGYSCVRSLVGHSHYVGAVAVVPGSGVAISGSNDKRLRPDGVPQDHAETAGRAKPTSLARELQAATASTQHVIVWDEASDAPLRVLEGHTDGDIISGSWDK
ncbi:hypothetical protein T492DRAFT_895781, partial [Pavlovales sp. CCMP2436]